MKIYILLTGIIFPVLFISWSWFVTKSGKLENRFMRISIIITGIMVGGVALALPLFPQPRLTSIILRFILGSSLTVLGLVFRIYPLLYMKELHTRSDLVSPSKLITTGPYSIVRHPQYVAGIFFITGWFLMCGGLYGLFVMPVFIIAILLQAYIEERYILIKEFGDKYTEYKSKVGMFLPKSGTK